MTPARRGHRRALGLIAPAASLVGALALSSLVLALTGHQPAEAYSAMWRFGTRLDSVISILDRAVPLYFSALAVAVGFEMGLFNIGVEGQYQLAVLLAAAAGAALALPPVLHVGAILLVAMAVGASWAGIAAWLRVRRGVHEVIATLMLNFVSTGLGAYLLASHLRAGGAAGALAATGVIPPSGRMPSLNRALRWVGFDVPAGSRLYGFLGVAVVVGIGYHVLVRRTRFGFDLRALGANPEAARVSGADPAGMAVRALLLSGALAGLVGMAPLLGSAYRYGNDFPTGLGFTGIAVALVGRKHPVGMALAALLFAFLDRSAQILDLLGIPREIVLILEGTILLSAVIVHELTRRIAEAGEARLAGGAPGRFGRGLMWPRR